MVDVHTQIRLVAKLSSALLPKDVRRLSTWSVFSMRALLKTVTLSRKFRSRKLLSFESLRSRLRLSEFWKCRDRVDRAHFTAFFHSWKRAVESTRCHGTLRH